MATTRGAPQNLEADGRDVLNGQDGRGSATLQNRRMEAGPIYQPGAGVAPMAQTSAAVSPLSSVRWGAIWAGVLSTLAVFVVLELFFYAIGTLTTISASGAISLTNEWLTTLLLAVSFFIGGMVAEATSAMRGIGVGILNGLMVWALGITAIVILSSVFGLSNLFGVIGYAAGGFLPIGPHIGLGSLHAVGMDVGHNARVVSLAAFFSIIIVAIAAAFGGFVLSYAKPIGRLIRR